MKIKYIILLLLVISCKSKQTTIETQKLIKLDLDHKFGRLVYDKPIKEKIIIENPCDSNGILKPFKQRFKTNHADITIESKDGNIQAQINIDSLKQEWLKEQQLKDSNLSESKIEEIVIYKWPWWVVYLIGYSISITLASGYLVFKNWF